MQIELKNLSLTYPNGKKALKNVNLSLKAPGMIGLLGPNGAGKSTLMKLLVASLLPTDGSIELDGKPLREKEGELKSMLGYLPQDFGLFDELTVAQFLDYMAAEILKGGDIVIANINTAVNMSFKHEDRYACFLCTF